jgi:hypothetical protein
MLTESSDFQSEIKGSYLKKIFLTWKLSTLARRASLANGLFKISYIKIICGFAADNLQFSGRHANSKNTLQSFKETMQAGRGSTFLLSI